LRFFISIFITITLIGLSVQSQAQTFFSVATDLSVQHNFRQDQRYNVIGQTISTQIHITRREGVYVSFTYYTNGKFSNNLVASAKQASTSPQQINYVNQSKMRLKEFAVGWKKYFTGAADTDNGFNIYLYAGFGLVLGRVINTHSVSIDTSLYIVPVLSGQANFKRLTIDPGLGVDHYLGGDLSMYGEVRAWIPTTDYPSRYIFVNQNAPWVIMFNIGFRIIF
jgi:hypothetical protein